MNEVWIFADWNKLSVKEKKTIIESKCTDVVLGIGGGRHNWKRYMSNTQVFNDARWLQANGIRCHLMFWITRNEKFITNCCEDVRYLVHQCNEKQIPIASLLYDAEREWHRGSYSVHSAVDQLQYALHSHITIPIGVTGLATLHSTVGPLLAICDYGLPQTYACWFPKSITKGKKHWSHSLSTEPGRVQRDGHRTWSPYNKPLVIGLGNYYLTRPPRFGRPKMTAIQNLTKCVEETHTLGYDRVAYWSLNSAHKRYIIQFFMQLQKDRIVGINPVPSQQIEVRINFAPAQWLLATMGYDLGNTGPHRDGSDGKWGAKSQTALNKFRAFRDMPINRRGPLTMADVLDLVEYHRSSLSV